MTTGMRRGWQVAAIIMLLLCLFMIWQSLLLSLRDKLGPGPGFFPFWLALIGAVLSAAVFLQTLREPATAGDEPLLPREGASIVRISAIVGLAVVASVVTPLLGFRLTMLIFAAALSIALGARNPLAIAAFSLVSSFGVYHVFNNWLEVVLPQGLLEELLGA